MHMNSASIASTAAHHTLSNNSNTLDTNLHAPSSSQQNQSQAQSSVRGGSTGAEDGVKNQFVTREGVYRVLPLSEYSRPNRAPLNAMSSTGGGASSTQTASQQGTNAPVRVSFLRVPQSTEMGSDGRPVNSAGDEIASCERICFNVGRELYVYAYNGVQSAADLSRPLDKRVYKGTCPTCHDFNVLTVTENSCSLLIGFSAGQIQLIDPLRKDREHAVSKLFNEERAIDKTKVTCLRWIPGDEHHFMVAHGSGQMYLYHDELPTPVGPIVYQLFKQGDGYAVHTCKTKSTRNPLYRWSIGQAGGGAVHEFAFSHAKEAAMMATVSQDGHLRIFNYHTMELVGNMRSYFGGLLCCAWSPDAKYVATGGEDDLLTVYSVHDRRVVCRGHGHKSWIAQVAFDAHTTQLAADGTTMHSASAGVPVDLGSEDDLRPANTIAGRSSRPHSGVGLPHVSSAGTMLNSLSAAPLGSCPPSTSLIRHRVGVSGRQKMDSVSSVSLSCISYRIGSVGHDTQLCLWDITEDVLKQATHRVRASTSHVPPPLADRLSGTSTMPADVTMPMPKKRTFLLGRKKNTAPSSTVNGRSGDATDSADGSNNIVKPVKLPLHKRGFSIGSRMTNAHSSAPLSTRSSVNGQSVAHETNDNRRVGAVDERLLGTTVCPRMDEPLVCKKIAQERLTVVQFRDECIVTACQEGFICTWGRPSRTMGEAPTLLSHDNSPVFPPSTRGGTVV